MATEGGRGLSMSTQEERYAALSPYHEWSPLNARPPLRWPDGARLAFCLFVTMEAVDWVPPPGSLVPPTLVRGEAYPHIPDVHLTSPREYGNRVGAYRVMKLLDRYDIKATAAVDAGIAEHYPALIDACRSRGWEFVAHGLRSSRMVGEAMNEDDEVRYIESSLAAVEAAAGRAPDGWMGVEYGESSRTVRLLAERGVRYVCDWPNDEQPYPMTVPTGSIVGLPIMADLDDVNALHVRRWPLASYTQMVIKAFDRLYEDGATNGRVVVLNVHPWVMGQPFRVAQLERIVRHVSRHTDVWIATGEEVVDCYNRQRM